MELLGMYVKYTDRSLPVQYLGNHTDLSADRVHGIVCCDLLSEMEVLNSAYRVLYPLCGYGIVVCDALKERGDVGIFS